MQYPLYVKFKKVALASQFSIVDSNGDMICYVKKKLLKLKEDIKVWKTRARQELLFSIRADRIIDWSANYTFYDKTEVPFGAIKRRGARSIWKARYHITGDNNEIFELNEESAFIRFMDSLLGGFGGLFFHPSYLITRANGTPVMKCKKMTSLFEAKFKIEALNPFNESEELKLLLGIMMMMMLERMRG